MYNENRGQSARSRASSSMGMRAGMPRHSDIPTAPQSRPCKAVPTDAAATRRFGLTGYPLAQVYAPIQEWQKINEPSEALALGTLFAELYLPFEGSGGRKGGF